ncbi:MAG: TIGR02301 family protein [Hyphomicrobium sp.]
MMTNNAGPRRMAVHRHRFVIAGAVACAMLTLAQPAHANSPDNKPYDDRLLRLSEILGAVHYLRELCGANDGQMWRDRMTELMNAEGSSALRRARLTRSFNQGYRSYSRTYVTCTPTAQTAISRFMAEGVQISEALMKAIP